MLDLQEAYQKRASIIQTSDDTLYSLTRMSSTLNFAPAAFGSLAARIDMADMDNASASSEWGNTAEVATDPTSHAGVRDELSSNKAVVSQDMEMGTYVTTLAGT